MVNLYQIDHGFFAAFAQSPGPRRGVTSCLWFNALTCACFFLVNGIVFPGKSTGLSPMILMGKSMVSGFNFPLNQSNQFVVLTILKNITSSMGRIVPYMKWKIKNVPNHQPVFVDASQITSVVMCHIYVPYIYICTYILYIYI